jgi:hypothetical protein
MGQMKPENVDKCELHFEDANPHPSLLLVGGWSFCFLLQVLLYQSTSTSGNGELLAFRV